MFQNYFIRPLTPTRWESPGTLFALFLMAKHCSLSFRLLTTKTSQICLICCFTRPNLLSLWLVVWVKLLALKSISHFTEQSHTLSRSFCKTWQSSTSLIALPILASLANFPGYYWYLNPKVYNKYDPSTDFWGILLVTTPQTDFFPFPHSLCFLSFRHSLIHLRTFPLICLSLFINLLCTTVSNSLLTSRYTAKYILPLTLASNTFESKEIKIIRHDIASGSPKLCEFVFFCMLLYWL